MAASIALAVNAEAQVYVNASAAAGGNGVAWGTAYSTLTAALDEINSGNPLHSGQTEIWVAEGTYTPGTSRTDTFSLPNGYSIYGGFVGGENHPDNRLGSAHNTVLSGEIDGVPGNSGNAFHVVTVNGGVIINRIDGLSIQDGHAEPSVAPNETGGGLLCDGSISAPVVIYMMDNCHFRNNAAVFGGGVGAEVAAISVKNCTFDRNLAYEEGGGMRVNGFAGPGYPAMISNCQFTSNFAGSGIQGSGGGLAIGWLDSRAYVYNCEFYGNWAFGGNGGAIHIGELRTYPCDIRHCTIANNGAALGAKGAGIYVADITRQKHVYNNILWNNVEYGSPNNLFSNLEGPGVAGVGPGTETLVEYSDIELATGIWTGIGNINADPLFVDVAAKDYKLSFGSPCINTGLDSHITADYLDLDKDSDYAEPVPFSYRLGQIRISTPVLPPGSPPVTAITDMGCHEKGLFVQPGGSANPL